MGVLDNYALGRAVHLLSICEGQQAAHPSELQRHHLWQPGQVAWLAFGRALHIVLNVQPSLTRTRIKESSCVITGDAIFRGNDHHLLGHPSINLGLLQAWHPRSGGHHPWDLYRGPQLQAGLELPVALQTLLPQGRLHQQASWYSVPCQGNWCQNIIIDIIGHSVESICSTDEIYWQHLSTHLHANLDGSLQDTKRLLILNELTLTGDLVEYWLETGCANKSLSLVVTASRHDFVSTLKRCLHTAARTFQSSHGQKGHGFCEARGGDWGNREARTRSLVQTEGTLRWMATIYIYMEKLSKIGWFGGTPVSGNIHLKVFLELTREFLLTNLDSRWFSLGHFWVFCGASRSFEGPSDHVYIHHCSTSCSR